LAFREVRIPMSRELHRTYQLTLETLSPIHIGSGKGDLLLDYDYLVEGNRAVIIDIDRLLEEVDEERLETAAEDPKLSLLLAPEETERYKAYEMDIAAGHPHRIRQHIKDAFERLYVPGSSIKGALRTALAWSAHYGALTLGGLGQRNDPNKADDSVEAGLLDYDPRNTHNDLLRALRITDAFPQISITPRALQVDIFSLRGQPPSLKPKGEPIFLEVIPRGTTMEATLIMDRYILRPERRVRGMYHFRKRHFFDQLIERCREFSGQLIKLELDFYSDCGIWKLQGFYEALAKRQASLQSDEFLMPIGWGTGWLAKTIGTKLTRGEVSTVADTYHLEKWQGPLFPEVFPKTRRLVGDRQASEPLGWVKMCLHGFGSR
jgi:CRISPR-associated protein Csm5